MRWLVLLGAALAAACPSTPNAAGRCDDTSDCPAGEQCAGGVCMAGPIPCGNTQPCPHGQACCGGICSLTQCCLADLDCAGGYCHTGACQSGPRPLCSQVTICPGRCLQTLDLCVECIYSDDCADPNLACSEDHRCLPPGTPCTVTSCAAQGLICSPTGNCRQCASTPECGTKVCDSGLCSPCSADPQCGLGRVCAAGACINDSGTPCTSNAECGDQICSSTTARCGPCASNPECGNGRACDAGHCVAVAPNCTDDNDCARPVSICQAGLCAPGCTSTSCAAGQECVTTTGRCAVISTGSLALGASCSAHGDCISNVCWPVYDRHACGGNGRCVNDPNKVCQSHDECTVLVTLCSQSCMRAGDCPADFVCLELGDGNFCASTSYFPGVTADVLPGGACSTGLESTTCKTGYCSTARGECMEMCGRNADCAGLDPGFACSSRWPVGADTSGNGFLEANEISLFTQLCHPPPVGALSTNSDCIRGGDLSKPPHERCRSRYCMQSPDFVVGPRCGLPCCTPSDCPGGAVCKPIHVWDGIYDSPGFEPYGYQKVCLWREYLPTVPREIGQACTTDRECRSEICIAGPSGSKRCTHTCCANRDCAAYDWAQACRPPFSGNTPVADANAAAMGASLGRQAYLINGTPLGTATAFTPVCMPR